MLTSSTMPTDEVRRSAQRIRKRVFEHVMRNGGGYLSQACSSAELFATLYGRVMRLGESEAPLHPPAFAGVPGRGNHDYVSGGVYNGPREPELDRFIFSPAHYALVLYAALIEFGRLDEGALEEFNRDGSTVEMIGAEHSPGVETTTGSLAQAISQAGGIALGRRLKGEPGRVWVLMSDGEFQEGQVWEAVQSLVHHRLDNLGVYADVNDQQCDGRMDDVMRVGSLGEKLRAFGARVYDVDGHDVEALARPAEAEPDGRPLFVLAHTDPTRGVPLLADRAPNLHYLRFASDDERERFQRACDAFDEEA